MSNSFSQISTQLTRVVLPLNICLSITGNLLNVLVLTRPSLFNNASTYYFLALAINNLFGSTIILIIDLLAKGYAIDITLLSLSSCKIIEYINDLCTVLSAYFIVLASLDRYCISSLNANRRKLSNIKTARWVIGFTVIFFAILYINSAILNNIDTTDGLGCHIRSKNIYYQIYPIFRDILSSIIAPSLMILFGLLAIFNTKQIHVHPIHIGHHHRRTQRQLTLMLFIQVSIFTILNLPICILYIILCFLPTADITPSYLFIILIFKFVQQFTYTTPFFLYIISGQIFRKELMQFFHRRFRRRRDNHILPVTHTHINPGSVPATILKETYH